MKKIITTITSLTRKLLGYLRTRSSIFYLYSISGVLFFFFCVGVLFFTPPLEDVYYPRVFVVSRGDSVSTIASDLREEKVIISESLFVLSNYLFGEKVLPLFA